MSRAMPTDPLQTGLLDALGGIRRRAKALGVLFGVGVVLTAAVSLLLVTVLIDYLLNLPMIPRLIFMLAALAGIVYTIWHYMARPLAARLTLGDVAGHLENVFPQFDDRLRSTVDFVRGDVPGSLAMKEKVILEAGEKANGVDLAAALQKRPVFYSMTAGLGMLLLAGVLAFSVPGNYLKTALSRLLLVHAQDWPKRVQIDMLKPLPAKIAVGQRLDLRIRLAKGDRASLRAVASYRYDNGAVQQQRMTRNDDGSYSVALDAKGEAMSVWVTAGDDQTQPAAIQVVQRLAINRAEARITPPPYAKADPFTVNLVETPASVTFGSTVELVLTFNKPLAADKPVSLEAVAAGAKLPQLTWTRPSSAVAIGTFTANESFRFRVHASDNDYFENPGIEEFDLIVRPDQNPSVIIENPRGHEDHTPVALVHLEAMAEDDFDISTMMLVVDRLGDKKHWEVVLTDWTAVDSAKDRRHFREKYEWELSQLPQADLKPGDTLEYFVRVTDNYNLNGAVHEPANSGKLKINIISQEALGHQVTEAMRLIAENVRLAQNSQNRTRQETTNLRQDTKEKPQFDPADRTALARLTEQEGTIASQTKQLAGRMNDLENRLADNRSDNKELNEIAKDVKSTLNQAAENPMTQAAQKLNEAAQQPADPKATPQEQKQQAEKRGASLENSERNQQEASNQLGKALAKMGNLGTFEQLIEQVREALQQQQNVSKKTAEVGKETIGKDPKQLTPEQKKKLDDVAAEQKKQSENTQKLTTALGKAAEQTAKSDPASSSAMQQASQQSQQQQVSSKQAQAAQSAQQNQQASAQAAQKQAELGLQMMLDTLREAERKKLEQLARDLAKLQEQIANLVRRQSGHNIDNLRIQGTDAAMKQITDDLLAEAERIRDKMPAAPDNDGLSRSQIQTEGNTRDVSKDAERVPRGGAEIAAALTRAAGFMERAIVGLKVPDLPVAYDPSQVKALAALEDARQKADAAAAEVQKQIDEASRDTIRQAYEKIRAEQDSLNKETLRIDQSPKLPDGSMRREDAVNVAKLPGQQGALADRTKELEKPLQDMGGVVYVWANKEIVDTMTDVKADLGKPTTAKPTQVMEQHVLDQLDAIIRNLAIKPKESDFNPPPGGGGGGGGGAPRERLPSEAELRLLKELQMGVNKATKDVSAEPKPDKPKLVSLGGRQGEFRNLLDQLMQKASRGQVKLDPEPDPKDRLPEEAGTGEIENQELDEWLRGGKSGDDQLGNDVKMVGQRMGRSRQRLALDNDPGKTTQLIQDRILTNLDNLIQLARAQEAQASAKPGKGQPGQKPQPGKGDQSQQQAGQPQQNRASTPATVEKRGGTGDNTADLTKDIRENDREWGHLTPRERQAIIEGTHEQTISKYEKITRDYYEMMAKKGAQEH